MDLLMELGTFAFASRLRRLTDRLKAEATTLYHNKGIDFNDSWFLVGYVLSERGALTVTETAKALGISSPAISQIVGEMMKRRLVAVQVDEKDRRRRVFSLTDRGLDAVEELRPVWEAIKECTDELIESTGCDFLGAISKIEVEIKKRCLFSRVTEKLYKTGRAAADGDEKVS